MYIKNLSVHAVSGKGAATLQPTQKCQVLLAVGTQRKSGRVSALRNYLGRGLSEHGEPREHGGGTPAGGGRR